MRRILAGWFIAGVLVAGAARAESNEKLEVELQAAMRRETVDGDLKGAVAEYQKIAARAGTNRDLAARALLRLGQCYRKQGDAQARVAFERIVREYGDQTQTAAEARAQLAALGAGDGAAAAKTQMSVRKLWTQTLAPGDHARNISADGRFVLLATSLPDDVSIRELKSGAVRKVSSTEGGHPRSFFLSPDGKWIVYGTRGRSIMLPGELRVMRADNGQAQTVFKAEARGAVFPYAWTPDSKQILCAVDVPLSEPGQPYKARRDVVLIPAAGGASRILKQNVDQDTWVNVLYEAHFLPSFSADGRYIAYSGPQKIGVWIMAADGSSDTQISKASGGREFVMGWSPDSNYLLLARNSAGELGFYSLRVREGKAQGELEFIKPRIGDIAPLGFDSSGAFYYQERHTQLNGYIAGLDAELGKLTSEPVRVTPRFDGSNAFPIWSADGKKLAFFGGRDFGLHDPHVVVRDLASGEETDTGVRFPASNGPSPTWLKDGSIVVGAGEKGVHSLYKLNPSTGEGIPMLRNAGEDLNQLSWSADGSKVYQVVKRKSLSVLDTSSGEQKVLYTDPDAQFIRDATPSPDGSGIAYVSNHDKGEIRIFSLATGQSRVLVNVWPAWDRRMMTWTPDGRYLIYTTEIWQGRGQPTALWIVPVAGGAPKKLGEDMEGRVFDVSISPDGRQIGFSRWADYGEAWMMENFLPKH